MSSLPVRSFDFNDVLASLDRRGRGFEALAAWFLCNDPEWHARIKRVWRWDEWSGRWGPDRGIDLVAETHDGGLIAVQCKHYGQRHTVTKAEVDSFLSESNRSQFQERLFVMTTMRLAEGARQVLAGQEKPVTLVRRDRLESAQLDWSGFLSGGPVPWERKQPKRHQHHATDNVVRRFERESRGQLLMPCGTGKTLTSLWISERLKARRTLLLFPTLELLRQTVQVWHAEANEPFDVLRVCGDPPSSDDEIAAADLSPIEAGTPITTDPKVIAAFLELPGRRVVFATYHSSPQIAQALALVGEPLDLVICDEAHYCAGPERGALKTVLDDEKIPARKRLFVTATPTMFSPSAKEKALTVRTKVASMDDRKLFGPVLHRLSFKSAVAEGLLCPYRVVIMPVTDEEVADMVERRHNVSPDHGEHVTDAHTLAAQIACLRVMQEHECRRLVAFHPRVEQSRRFAEELGLAAQLMREDERPNEFSAAHIDGYMTRPRRELLLRGFAGNEDRAQVLSNVRLLTEGVDVPRIDAICLVDTHRRPSAVVQAVGRVVRTAPGKEHGIVLVPVLRRDGEPLERALRRSEHRGALEVLAALVSIDTEIRNMVDAVRIELGPRRPTSVSTGTWVVDAATEVDDDFAKAVEVCLVDVLGAERSTPSEPRERSDVRGVLWDLSAGDVPDRPDWTSAETFDEAIVAAQRWREENGYQPLERFDVSGDFPLGEWWTLLLRLLQLGVHVDRELLVRCAEPLNYAAISTMDYPRARARLARAAPSDLAARVDTWLENPYDFCQDGILRAHASNRRIGPYGVVRAADLVEHIPDRVPGDHRLAVTEIALRLAGDALHRANQEPHAACQGFMDAVTHPDQPHDLQGEPLSQDELPVGIIQCYLSAWEAGQEAVRLLRSEHRIDPDRFEWPEWFSASRS